MSARSGRRRGRNAEITQAGLHFVEMTTVGGHDSEGYLDIDTQTLLSGSRS